MLNLAWYRIEKRVHRRAAARPAAEEEAPVAVEATRW